MKQVQIIRDEQEKGCTVRGRPSYRRVPAWRIVDMDRSDLVQPWFDSITEAREHVKWNNNQTGREDWQVVHEDPYRLHAKYRKSSATH